MQNKTVKALTFAVIVTILAALLPGGMIFAAEADVTLATTLRQEEPITAYLRAPTFLPSLDPQISTDSESIDALENLFLGLTNTDALEVGKITPELATAWSANEAGDVWTFTIRNDVPWVRWDPVAEEAEVMRMVTAQDFEYGIKRACDPRLGSLYGAVAAAVIAGCDELNQMEYDDIAPEDYDLVQVQALDDSTLEVTLQFPAGFFFSMTPMWMLRAVPQEVIEEYGDDWTEIGNIWTNGPFVIDEWIRGVRRVYMRNPHIPADLVGPGNVERVIMTVIEDDGTAFALWQDNQIEVSGVPAAELQAVLSDPAYADQLYQVSNLAVYYFAFAHDKEPTSDVHVRRAISASVDRNAYVQEVRQGRGIPMIHFTPPGMFGAPPINEVGVGYDPEYARAELALSDYPNCEGMPNMEVVTYQGAGVWAEFLSASMERELGCDPNVLTIEQQEFSVLLQTTDPRNPPEDRPNMWTLGWGPDYPDAHNWVFDAGVISCDSENNTNRACTEMDDLIRQAAQESDAETRIELYYRIEEMAFGPEGEHPILPLFLGVGYSLRKPWYDRPFETDGLFGGFHMDWINVDQEAQLAARGG